MILPKKKQFKVKKIDSNNRNWTRKKKCNDSNGEAILDYLLFASRAAKSLLEDSVSKETREREVVGSRICRDQLSVL